MDHCQGHSDQNSVFGHDCKQDASRMEYSDSGPASTRFQRDNKQKGIAEGSAWQNGSQKKLQSDGRRIAAKNRKDSHKKIQDDGRKVKRKEGEEGASGNVEDEEMSRPRARYATFKDFEKTMMIDKLVDSGYYYTGKDDTTMCYKCRAEVFDWEEKDEPSVFHEPHCSFHRSDEVETGQMEESHISLLDAPTTDSNDVLPPPVLIKPIPATSMTTSEVSKGHFEETVPISHAAIQSNLKVLSLPLPQEKTGDVGSGRVRSLGNQKIFPMKPGRKPVQIREVLTHAHQQLLAGLNLWSEEDRRKSFSADGKWEQNTNNVVSPYELAKDGFFYLGNLDRTECCCCGKVFRNWVRGDDVNRVHRQTVQYCRLARGEDTENVTIPNWQVGSLSPGRSGGFEPTIAPSFGVDISETLATEASQISTPSHQAQRVQIPAANKPYYTKPGILTYPSQAVTGVSPKRHRESGLLPSPTEPLDLSQGRRAKSLSPRHSLENVQDRNMSARSFPLPQPKISLISVPISKQSQAQLAPNPEASLPSHENSHLQERSIARKPEDSHYGALPAELPTPGELSWHSVPSSTTGGISSLPFEVVPEDRYRGVQPQSASSSPDPESLPPENVSRSIEVTSPITSPTFPPASFSSHIGQTTLYNHPASISREHSLTQLSPTGVPISPLSPTPSASNAPTAPFGNTSATTWSTIFPCDEPSNPNFRTAVAREETYDYRWPSSRFQSSINEFAKAGFYYMGNEDHVRCWYCNGGVLHWNGRDDPWEEHARLYPTCEYVLQQKGPEFVSEVSARNQGSSQPMPPRVRLQESSSSSSSYSPGYGTPGSSPGFGSPTPGSPMVRILGHNVVNRFGGNSPPRVIDPRVEEARQKQELERALNSEAVLSAMEMGFEMNQIKKVIKRKLRSSAVAFANTEALMEALLAFVPAGSTDSSDSDMEPENAPSTSTGPENSGMTPGATNRLFPAQGTGTTIPQPRPSLLQGAEGLDPRQLDERLREYQQEKRCKVCLDRDADVVFVPCGHLCTCVQCAGALRTCPLCRKRIQKSIKTYTS